MDLSFFKPLFHINTYMCGGVDGLISKIHLIAVQEGKFLLFFQPIFSDQNLIILLYFSIGRLVHDAVGVPLVVRQKRQPAYKKKQYDIDGDLVGDSTIVHEVKRVGLLIDRYVDLELRIGDHLIIYISKN